jgi:glycolate oxidase FAD binding subunit
MQVEVREGDAILGLRPRLAFAPASVEECAATMQYAARKQLQIGFIGGATALDLGPPPNGLDAVVRTERLTRIVEHVPSDMVVVVEAGVTLAALQAALAALVLADGTVAHGGGKVVKNVAGFDLPKIACGSLGTLAMIATASFRLHPLPQKSATVLIPAIQVGDVFPLVRAARDRQLEPTSFVVLTSAEPGRHDLGVRFEGFGGGVEQQVSRMIKLGQQAGLSAEPLSDDAAAAFWRRHDAVRTAAPLRIRVSDARGAFELIARIAGMGDTAWYATLGICFAGGVVGDVAATAAAVTDAREYAESRGGSLVVEAAPPELRARLEPWGRLSPPAFKLMQQLKLRFDHEWRLNSGRFVGGL